MFRGIDDVTGTRDLGVVFRTRCGFVYARITARERGRRQTAQNRRVSRYVRRANYSLASEVPDLDHF